MFLTAKIERFQSQIDTTVLIEAPFSYISCDVRGATLYYTRLPLAYTAEQIVKYMSNQNYSFIANCEGNFILALVLKTEERKSLTLVKDRFNSQRILFTQADDSFIISSSQEYFPLKKDNINHDALYEALRSRILTEHVLQKDVSIVPLNYGLHFDEKRLDLIELSKDKLKVLESPNPLSSDEALALIKQSLNQTYQVLNVETPIAVLLSGGVDSFILAATAQRYFRNVCAYTPNWDGSKNPELSRAVRFAEKLGIKHHIINVTASDFVRAFKEVINISRVPNRNYSSLVLHSLFDSIKEKHIFYGEYADTLFGSFPIKAGIMDEKYSKLSKIFPKFLQPRKLQATLTKIENHSLNDLTRIEKIDHCFIKRWAQQNGINTNFLRTAQTSYEPFSRTNGITKALQTDCAQHMQEIEMSALLKNKIIVTPFYNQRMLDISNRLDEYQMFGKSGLRVYKNFKQATQNQVKPYLKQLACEFIDKDAIYLKKLGFPTPFHVWIEHVVDACNDSLKEELSLFDSAEQKWSALNLSLILSLNTP